MWSFETFKGEHVQISSLDSHPQKFFLQNLKHITHTYCWLHVVQKGFLPRKFPTGMVCMVLADFPNVFVV